MVGGNKHSTGSVLVETQAVFIVELPSVDMLLMVSLFIEVDATADVVEPSAGKLITDFWAMFMVVSKELVCGNISCCDCCCC